jgi:hypothetical protein
MKAGASSRWNSVHRIEKTQKYVSKIIERNKYLPPLAQYRGRMCGDAAA